jgi:hypothetical protein
MKYNHFVMKTGISAVICFFILACTPLGIKENTNKNLLSNPQRLSSEKINIIKDKEFPLRLTQTLTDITDFAKTYYIRLGIYQDKYLHALLSSVVDGSPYDQEKITEKKLDNTLVLDINRLLGKVSQRVEEIRLDTLQAIENNTELNSATLLREDYSLFIGDIVYPLRQSAWSLSSIEPMSSDYIKETEDVGRKFSHFLSKAIRWPVDGTRLDNPDYLTTKIFREMQILFPNDGWDFWIPEDKRTSSPTVLGSDGSSRENRLSSSFSSPLFKFKDELSKWKAPFSIALKGDWDSTLNANHRSGTLSSKFRSTLLQLQFDYGNKNKKLGHNGSQKEYAVLIAQSFNSFFIEGGAGGILVNSFNNHNWLGYKAQVTLGYDADYLSPFVQIHNVNLANDSIRANETIIYLGFDAASTTLNLDSAKVKLNLVGKLGLTAAHSLPTHSLSMNAKFIFTEGVCMGTSLDLDAADSKLSISIALDY